MAKAMRLRSLGQAVVGDDPFLALVVAPEFGAGHEEDAPAGPPAFGLLRPEVAGSKGSSSDLAASMFRSHASLVF